MIPADILWLLPLAFLAAGVFLRSREPDPCPSLSPDLAAAYGRGMRRSLDFHARVFFAGAALQAVVFAIVRLAA